MDRLPRDLIDRIHVSACEEGPKALDPSLQWPPGAMQLLEPEHRRVF